MNTLQKKQKLGKFCSFVGRSRAKIQLQGPPPNEKLSAPAVKYAYFSTTAYICTGFRKGIHVSTFLPSPLLPSPLPPLSFSLLPNLPEPSLQTHFGEFLDKNRHFMVYKTQTDTQKRLFIRKTHILYIPIVFNFLY